MKVFPICKIKLLFSSTPCSSPLDQKYLGNLHVIITFKYNISKCQVNVIRGAKRFKYSVWVSHNICFHKYFWEPFRQRQSGNLTYLLHMKVKLGTYFPCVFIFKNKEEAFWVCPIISEKINYDSFSCKHKKYL